MDEQDQLQGKEGQEVRKVMLKEVLLKNKIIPAQIMITCKS